MYVGVVFFFPEQRICLPFQNRYTPGQTANRRNTCGIDECFVNALCCTIVNLVSGDTTRLPRNQNQHCSYRAWLLQTEEMPINFRWSGEWAAKINASASSWPQCSRIAYRNQKCTSVELFSLCFPSLTGSQSSQTAFRAILP